VDDFLKKGMRPKNITNNPAAIDDDPDWSPQGQKIVFTSHPATDSLKTDDHPAAEIYVIDAGRVAKPKRLTNNIEEERARRGRRTGGASSSVAGEVVATSKFASCAPMAPGRCS
jgi:Tol biopolymer transport system component